MRFSSLLLLLLLASAPATRGKSLPDNSVDDPGIIRRADWGARQPKGPLAPLAVEPPPYVIVHHAASDTCTSRAICQARLRSFQDYHMNTKKWSDIGYNFLVGEDGNVYEGRGWGKAGAHAKTYNDKSIGICVIGNYENRSPNSAATEAVKSLISHGVSLGKINKAYSLIGHRQASPTSCPGNKLYQLVQTWPNWVKSP
ncbi:peptidoglycan-recognition protein SC2 [Nasonia vitripennis]|uniref:Peptidoglycan-recognition protein n=1 Tax=Nasonia vitripennis TaxID=7425 RepID=A0A7M7G5T1_NASVI|nr:peptidoglycan-recognition protein SC2 [Nasonia vitripennis]